MKRIKLRCPVRRGAAGRRQRSRRRRPIRPSRSSSSCPSRRAAPRTSPRARSRRRWASRWASRSSSTTSPAPTASLGIDSVAKSPPDGYTILLTDRGSLTVNPSLYAKLPYDPIKDFSYIGIATDGPVRAGRQSEARREVGRGSRRARRRPSRARSTTRASASAAWRSSISKRSTRRWAPTCCTCRTRARRRRRRRWSLAKSA